MQLRPLPDPDGLLAADAIAGAVADAGDHLPALSAVATENPHMPESGRPWTVEQVVTVADAAHRHGLGVHCDGARIWNAAVALGVAPSRLAAPVDTLMFCLSKGLAAPIGSVLCGPQARIDTAREHRARLGGSWRQAGILAAAGLVALETMVDRLADDHARAGRLAVALADRWPGSVDPAAVQTNIVCVADDTLPTKLVERLDEHGIRAGRIDARTVRFVTHKDVDDDDVTRTIAALDAIRKEDT